MDTVKDILNMTAIAQKNEIWQIELDRIMVLEPRKGNNHESKEPAYSMGNIFTSYTLDRGLATKIYKELQKLNTRKANPSNQ